MKDLVTKLEDVEGTSAKSLSKEAYNTSQPGIDWSLSVSRKAFHRLLESSLVNWSCLAIGIAFVAWLVYKCYKETKTEKPINTFARDFYNADAEGKLYAYASEHLLTWSLLLRRTFWIIFSWRVWIVVPCVLCVAWAVACMIVYEVPYANKLDTKRMDTIAEYLRVFIVFKLGLYMNTSLQRWWAAVCSFKTSLATIKELVWTVHMMNLRMTIIRSLKRRCILACYILEAEMHTGLGVEDVDCAEYWDAMFSFLTAEKLLSSEEETSLRTDHCAKHLGKHHGARSSLVWAWIGRTISVILYEPGVLAPMCVRLVALCHTAMTKAEELKIHGAVQVPFSYSYLLAVLVHSNNVLLAVSSGIFIAQALGNVSKGERQLSASDSSVKTQTALSRMYVAFEVLWTQMFLLVFQPLMYQAFLGIAHVLNHPFGNKVFHLPSETYIRLFREELDVITSGYAESPLGMDHELTRSQGLPKVKDDDEEGSAAEDDEAHDDDIDS